MEFAKKTKCRHSRASCEGLWNIYDADSPSSRVTEVQLKANAGGVIKEKSDWLQEPLAIAP